MDKSGNEPQSRYGEMERELAEQLESGPLEEGDKERKTKAKLSPKYEIRIQTEHDPIVEETKIYRKMAREVDDNYDKYMDRVPSERNKEE
jgi:hypothetical protein